MGNGIGDDGARAVSDALKVNSSITEIWLDGHDPQYTISFHIPVTILSSMLFRRTPLTENYISDDE